MDEKLAHRASSAFKKAGAWQSRLSVVCKFPKNFVVNFILKEYLNSMTMIALNQL